ncbi:hypothetical protein KHQ81_08530 [Mycoplasmatota bacterium]|nr:hypothetical protein KHQ81_08530 [Mycoplasmatota bacterium]
MKKIIISFMVLMTIICLIGCRAQKPKIDVDEIKVDISVYQLLPKNLLENSKKQVMTTNINQENYKSDVYAKLLYVYQYIDELFVVFSEILDQALDNHVINSGEVYNYNQYEYFATIDKTTTRVSIDDTDTDRTLQVTVKNLKDGNKAYSGIHKIQYDTFTFDYLNQKEMKIHFDQGNEQKKSYATISKEENIVKTHVIYDEGISSYELYSIATDDAISILYLYNKKDDVYLNQNFEVVDHHGDILYRSFSIDQGVYQATGWLLNALNIQDIQKISTNEFMVNTSIFNNNPNDINLYEISMDGNEYTYMLGYLNYNQNLVPIIKPRAPFETSYYTVVSNLAKETIAYYDSINQ